MKQQGKDAGAVKAFLTGKGDHAAADCFILHQNSAPKSLIASMG